jgi:Lhr-like helicase
MNVPKRIGIWMDHASANLMEFTQAPIETEVVESAFTHEEKVNTIKRSEATMHHKEQHEEGEYYDRLGDLIRGYDEVLLFGPTNAKTELLNRLREDHRFENIKINVQQTDKMTENQQHAFVKNHFSRHG